MYCLRRTNTDNVPKVVVKNININADPDLRPQNGEESERIFSLSIAA